MDSRFGAGSFHPASGRSLPPLKETLDCFSETTVLEFDEAAAAHFERLQQLRLRVGTMDLKIAAIALARDATVLSRNLKDFTRVPGLRVEDWTR